MPLDRIGISYFCTDGKVKVTAMSKKDIIRIYPRPTYSSLRRLESLYKTFVIRFCILNDGIYISIRRPPGKDITT